MKFKKKYRIESARLRSWDYASPGWYFVTLCTKHKEIFFGNVIDGEMDLSEAGRIVSEEWLKTAKIRSNIILDEWVVMPNHMHGILVITERMPRVETPWSLQLQNGNPPHWGQSSTNLNQYQRNESVVQEHQTPAFAWQPRFYDHIIRNEDALSRIRTYIQNNPEKWEQGKYYC